MNITRFIIILLITFFTIDILGSYGYRINYKKKHDTLLIIFCYLVDKLNSMHILFHNIVLVVSIKMDNLQSDDRMWDLVILSLLRRYKRN